MALAPRRQRPNYVSVMSSTYHNPVSGILNHNKIIRHQIKPDIYPNKQPQDLKMSATSLTTSQTFSLGSPRNHINNKQQDKKITQGIKSDSWSVAGLETKLTATQLSFVCVCVWEKAEPCGNVGWKTKGMWPQTQQLEEAGPWDELNQKASIPNWNQKQKQITGYAEDQKSEMSQCSFDSEQRRDIGLVEAVSLKCREVSPKNIGSILL